MRRPDMVPFFNGWAATADTWMVCAFTREEAWRRFIAAEVHGKPHSQRPPIWVPWLCWWAAILVAIDGMIDGGSRVNAGLFFSCGVLGFAAMFMRPDVFCLIWYAAEMSFGGLIYWSYPAERFYTGPVLLCAFVSCVVVWVDHKVHLLRRVRFWFTRAVRGREGKLIARR